MLLKRFLDFSADIKENKSLSAKKPTKYTVVRYDAPNSGRVVDRTTIHASSKDELHGHIRNWMEKGGLDPDDEDDHAHINYKAS